MWLKLSCPPDMHPNYVFSIFFMQTYAKHIINLRPSEISDREHVRDGDRWKRREKDYYNCTIILF